jgi:hypothetical protein
MTRQTNSARKRQRREAETYRQATEIILEQVSWCIEFLHRNRKHEIARALDRNLKTIIRRYQL